jgi:hypothetical protein
MSIINRQCVLVRRPERHLKVSDFAFQQSEISLDRPAPGEIIVKNMMFLHAPTMRNWMDPPGNSLYPSIPLDVAVMAPAAGQVVASAHADFPVGSLVSGIGHWQDYEVLDVEQSGVMRLPDDMCLMRSFGVFNLNKQTAYFGLLKVGQPKAGETLVVSGAAGSTGSTAAQIGKIMGCRVIGIAGGRQKCDWLLNECGLDAVIDYKSENIEKRLAELCPNGIDIFFDNVGGDVLQAATNNMARLGRIVLCGQISAYDTDQQPEGPRNMMRLIYGSITMRGFLVGDYKAEAPAAIAELAGWEKAGKLSHLEDIRSGFEKLPETLLSIFDGTNNGTLLSLIDGSALPCSAQVAEGTPCNCYPQGRNFRSK